MAKCLYCGRELREHERYCDFCDQDIGEKPYNIRKGIRSSINRIKGIRDKFRKKTANNPPPRKSMEAYCVKCRKKVDMQNPKEYIMKNSRIAVKGHCPYCSTKIFRIKK